MVGGDLPARIWRDVMTAGLKAGLVGGDGRLEPRYASASSRRRRRGCAAPGSACRSAASLRPYFDLMFAARAGIWPAACSRAKLTPRPRMGRCFDRCRGTIAKRWAA